MKLNQYFPSVVKAFKEIDMESHGFQRVNARADVPTRYFNRLTMADEVLSTARNKRMSRVWRDCTAKQREEMLEAGIAPTDSAFSVICNPVNDSAKMTIKALGWSQKYVKATEFVLNEYFDGDLGPLFSKSR